MSKLATPEALAQSFSNYLREENLYALLPQISQALHEEVLRNQDIAVISATTLSEAQQKDIGKELVEKWGEHAVIFSVDPSLVSGMIIHFQDTIIDLSGRSTLRELQQTLAKTDD